jgi:hypothetical protein
MGKCGLHSTVKDMRPIVSMIMNLQIPRKQRIPWPSLYRLYNVEWEDDGWWIGKDLEGSGRDLKVVPVLNYLSTMPWHGIAAPFLTSALDGGEWLASRPGRFTPGERAPNKHWTGGWVGPRVGLDAVEKRKIYHCLESNPGPSSPLLYRLSYPGICSRDWGKPRKASVMIAGGLPGIRTEYIPNVSLERYRFVNLLSRSLLCRHLFIAANDPKCI